MKTTIGFRNIVTMTCTVLLTAELHLLFIVSQIQSFDEYLNFDALIWIHGEYTDSW